MLIAGIRTFIFSIEFHASNDVSFIAADKLSCKKDAIFILGSTKTNDLFPLYRNRITKIYSTFLNDEITSQILECFHNNF